MGLREVGKHDFGWKQEEESKSKIDISHHITCSTRTFLLGAAVNYFKQVGKYTLVRIKFHLLFGGIQNPFQ